MFRTLLLVAFLGAAAPDTPAPVTTAPVALVLTTAPVVPVLITAPVAPVDDAKGKKGKKGKKGGIRRALEGK